jgi:biopolymer transport protein ExbD
MDVFTILVFFLLVNSSTSEVLDTPKEITLPDSIVESKPRESVVVLVSTEAILVQGEPVVTIQDALSERSSVINPLKVSLQKHKGKIIGIKTGQEVKGDEVTILAHKTVPFKLLKKVMSSCTSAGYSKISLAVIQKASNN